MRVAITGATGLIGTALRRSLERDGHRVTAVVRREPGPEEVRWDPDGGTIDAAGLEGHDAVVHLAAENVGERRWTEAQKAKIRDSRVLGTALLAGALSELERKPRVLVSASGVNYYGDRGDSVVTEASPAGSSFLARVCVDWEAATVPAAEVGIRVAMIRSGVVLAPGGGALGRMIPLFRFGLGGKLGSGRQYWSWISLIDEVRAIRFLIDHQVHGPVNLCSPKPATNAEFTAALAKVLHRPAIFPVPSFGPSLLLGRELAQELAFSSTRAVPTVLTEAGFTFTHTNLEHALAAMFDDASEPEGASAA